MSCSLFVHNVQGITQMEVSGTSCAGTVVNYLLSYGQSVCMRDDLPIINLQGLQISGSCLSVTPTPSVTPPVNCYSSGLTYYTATYQCPNDGLDYLDQYGVIKVEIYDNFANLNPNHPEYNFLVTNGTDTEVLKIENGQSFNEFIFPKVDFTYGATACTQTILPNWYISNTAGLSQCVFVTPTPTPTITQTSTQTPTPNVTSTPTITQTITQTNTQSLTPTLTSTPTQTPTLTNTKTPTPTLTNTNTPTITPSPNLSYSGSYYSASTLCDACLNQNGNFVTLYSSGSCIDTEVVEYFYYDSSLTIPAEPGFVAFTGDCMNPNVSTAAQIISAGECDEYFLCEPLCITPTPTPTTTSTPNVTPTTTPTYTITNTLTPTPTPTITNTNSSTPNVTPTNTTTPTNTVSKTPTATPAITPTNTTTPTNTITPTTTLTQSQTPAVTPTPFNYSFQAYTGTTACLACCSASTLMTLYGNYSASTNGPGLSEYIYTDSSLTQPVPDGTYAIPLGYSSSPNKWILVNGGTIGQPGQITSQNNNGCSACCGCVVCTPTPTKTSTPTPTPTKP